MQIRRARAYIVGLGVNDVINARQPMGSMADVCDDWHRNANTFAGWYGQLLARLREIQPDAVLFLITMPQADEWNRSGVREIVEAHRALMYEMAAHFGNAYVLDLYRYAPVHDKAYTDAFYMGGHLSPVGYRIAAEQIVSYIDYIVRHDPAAFRRWDLSEPPTTSTEPKAPGTVSSGSGCLCTSGLPCHCAARGSAPFA